MSDQTIVASPNGRIRLTLMRDQGRLMYAISSDDNAVVERSPIVLTVDGVDLCEGVESGDAQPSIERFEIDETYPWRGNRSEAVNHCNGARVSLRHAGNGTGFTFEARAFDDGAAFRLVVPGEAGQQRIPDEMTAFTLPAGTALWHHDLHGHYEGTHTRSDAGAIPSGTWIAPPMTCKLPGGTGYCSITESALINYSGMAIESAGDRRFIVGLAHRQPVSYPFELRYSKEEIARFSKPAAVTGTITTPWRVVMIGKDLNQLVNCEIVNHLAPPPDPELFPQGAHSDWVRPGRAVWRYLDGGSERDLPTMKEFSRLAGELGFEYHVIEGFWSRFSDDEVRELVEFSHAQGVRLLVWVHTSHLFNPAIRRALFEKCKKLGLDGFKIDFFDHEHKGMIDHYQNLLREAARLGLVVNFHGANKPAGEGRTWPNELTREGIKGMEYRSLKERAIHDATLPFTRFLAGPGDYTPVHFGERRADTTWAHQIATAAVFLCPLQTYAAQPQTLLDHPAVDMIKSIPATWDETIVLPGSEIGEVAAFARRSGRTWFLAVVNGPKARGMEVSLSFLSAGKHRAMLVRDDPDDSAAVVIERDALHESGDTIAIKLSAGGGFVGRFSPQ